VGISAVNDFVVKFANVNGSGSASANLLFAKAVFRMGIPVAPRNIFPSNIQGLPTWFEVRINENGYLGRRDSIDLMVAMNAETMSKDIASIRPGGYLLYDSTRALPEDLHRSDIEMIGIPIARMCLTEYSDPKQRLLFKNIVYIGALSALLDIKFEILENLVKDQFKGKQKLIQPNIDALKMGSNYIANQYDCPLGIHLKPLGVVQDKILVDGNSMIGLGCVYAGATVAGWYPITPSTSVIDAFARYAHQFRVAKKTGKNKFAICQAEDELAAIGMVIGACWNGARAFTATSGPGISLMSEFLGLAYFAEIPAVLFNIQRIGPSTGMPTRTQQGDVLACAYASHGDTKQVLLFPSTVKECFDMATEAFELADRIQTPVIVMSDLDLGMNDSIADALEWDDNAIYNRGKVLSAEELDHITSYGRYQDVDGDGIGYRTYPGTHPSKGSFFTRGTSRDPDAIYTEDGKVYAENMDRLSRKFITASNLVPQPAIMTHQDTTELGVICYGTTAVPMDEVDAILKNEEIKLNHMRIRAFPFSDAVFDFIEQHDIVFVVEQNRDGQMRTLIVNEGELHPDKLLSIVNYDGMPITAQFIADKIKQLLVGTVYESPRLTG